MSVDKSRFVWKELVLKDVSVLDRPGKTPLTFVDVVDPNTYESSGQYLYLPVDRGEQLPPKGSLVDVYTKPGTYGGRPAISFASVTLSKATGAQKVS